MLTSVCAPRRQPPAAARTRQKPRESQYAFVINVITSLSLYIYIISLSLSIYYTYLCIIHTHIYIYIYIYTHISIYVLIPAQVGPSLARASMLLPRSVGFAGWLVADSFRKGTNGVSTNGVTANLMFLDRGSFWGLPLTYFYLPKSARAYLFSNRSKFMTFAAAPLVLTPFVRNHRGSCWPVGRRQLPDV